MLRFVTTLILGGVAGLYYIIQVFNRKRKCPPGPYGVPFFGNAFQIDPLRPHITLTAWNQKYGDIFQINTYGKRSIVISSYEGIRTVLITKSTDFAGRPYLFREDLLNGFRPGFSFGDYSLSLMKTKKTVMTAIKMHGDGLDKLESISLDIIQDLITDMQALEETPFDPLSVIMKSVVNIMSCMVSV